MKKTDINENKFIASMLLHALGDTIGFKNGYWEFNNFKKSIKLEDTLELLYEFIELGGINHLSIKNWKVSDDTILHITMAKSLIIYDKMSKDKNIKNIDIFGKILKKQFINIMDKTEKFKFRYPGMASIKYIKRLKKGGKWNDTPYDINAGGSGASMRSSCIGLLFNGVKNRRKLIVHSIEASRITHNCAIAYLGGMTAALFTAFAIEGLNIYDWPFELIKILESNIIDDYLKKTRGHREYLRDNEIFIDKWKRYLDDKFVNRKPVYRKSFRNIVYRGRYYYSNFASKQMDGHGGFIGSGGDDSVIIAYDCLVDSQKNWEKLVIYSMLHMGDTDTTGCIAGSWYGAMYGLDDVPKKMLKYIEYNDKIIQIAKKLHSISK